jgi:hypothetical protein
MNTEKICKMFFQVWEIFNFSELHYAQLIDTFL